MRSVPEDDEERRRLLDQLTKGLTHRERFIVTQYYQVGHTLREIGEMLALPEEEVTGLYSDIMNRLRAEMDAPEDPPS
jgi:RNA polymerase sigma factor (sigma-70 family)